MMMAHFILLYKQTAIAFQFCWWRCKDKRNQTLISFLTWEKIINPNFSAVRIIFPQFVFKFPHLSKE